jgi:hypothetical protein
MSRTLNDSTRSLKNITKKQKYEAMVIVINQADGSKRTIDTTDPATPIAEKIKAAPYFMAGISVVAILAPVVIATGLFKRLGSGISLHNVQEHAPPLAGAHVETGIEVHDTGDVADSAASGGCVSRLVRNSSFCYEVREVGIGCDKVAQMIKADWVAMSCTGPIPVIVWGAGLWVIREMEKRGISCRGVEINAGGVGRRIASASTYHVVDMTDNPEELNRGTVRDAVTNGDRSNRGVGFGSNATDDLMRLGESFDGIVGSGKLVNFKNVLCRIIHRTGLKISSQNV